MESGLLRQFTLTLLVSMVTLSSGMCTGWLSPIASDLRFGPAGRMTTQEISYLDQIPRYVGLLVTVVYGLVASKMGRKDSLVLVGIPSVASSLMLAFGSSKIALYVGRGLAGCTMVGGSMVSLMYVSETVNDSIRGTFMAVLILQFYVGILLSGVVGGILSYQDFNLLGVAVPLLYTILFLWLPESPHYLITKRRVKDALKSLIWLRNGDLAAAKFQLKTIKADPSFGEDRFTKILTFGGTRIALTTSLLACILLVTSGIQAISTYSKTVFNATSSTLGSVDSTIVILMLISVAVFCSIFLIDTVGRKILLYISFAGSCVSLALLSSFLFVISGQMETTNNYSWLPITIVSLFLISYGVGLATVPAILTNELAPPKVKPMISAIVAAAVLVLLITIEWSFTYVKHNAGLSWIFSGASVFNLLGIFFTKYVLLTETMGKSMVAIKRDISGERVMIVNANLRV